MSRVDVVALPVGQHDRDRDGNEAAHECGGHRPEPRLAEAEHCPQGDGHQQARLVPGEEPGNERCGPQQTRTGARRPVVRHAERRAGERCHQHTEKRGGGHERDQRTSRGSRARSEHRQLRAERHDREHRRADGRARASEPPAPASRDLGRVEEPSEGPQVRDRDQHQQRVPAHLGGIQHVRHRHAEKEGRSKGDVPPEMAPPEDGESDERAHAPGERREAEVGLEVSGAHAGYEGDPGVEQQVVERHGAGVSRARRYAVAHHAEHVADSADLRHRDLNQLVPPQARCAEMDPAQQRAADHDRAEECEIAPPVRVGPFQKRIQRPLVDASRAASMMR